MTTALVLVSAVGAALIVHLGWPRDPLRRLARVPAMAWPAWLRPKASALPARTRGIAAAGAAVTSTLVLDIPLPASLVLGTALGCVVFWVLGRLETGGAAATRAQLVSELPTALDVLAACVASGMPLRGATAAVASAVGGPLGERLASVVARTAAGFGDGDAWAPLRGDEVLGSVARDLARAADAGTAIGALLARHAEAARSAAHAAALARAKAVGVQTIIPVSVCYLPAFFLLGVVPVIAGVLASLLP
ncbi:MAG TPA: type II secretion system F family protein [Propionibacteriaceae bacterium]